jgi:hypothetical protein
MPLNCGYPMLNIDKSASSNILNETVFQSPRVEIWANYVLFRVVYCNVLQRLLIGSPVNE